MFRIFWIIFFALGLMLFTSLGQAQQEAQNEQGQTATEQNQPQTLPIPLPVEIIEDQSESDSRKRREAETSQHEKADLAAQQGMNIATQAMNEATQRMADYSEYSTWIVGFGTILLIGTLWTAIAANCAAQEAVKVTRDIGQAQVRAYCNVANVDIVEGDPVSAGVGFGMVFAKITIKNYGDTPAFQSRGWAVCNSYSRSAGRLRNQNRSSPESRFPMGSGTLHSLTVPLQIPNEATLSDEQIYVHGFWVYRDCFDKQRLTKFRYFLDEVSGTLKPALRGNFST